MNTKILTLLIYSFIILNISKAQEGNWDVYLAQYENGPGSITLNMDLIVTAPKNDLPYILVTGVEFENCREDGFPNSDEFEKLYMISDGILELLKDRVKFELAGTFTHQCERLDYVYLSDTLNIRETLTNTYKSKYGDYKFYINLKDDKNWEAYTKFLYPNEVTLEYMSNQKVLTQLQKAGDNLSKERQIDHWIYFVKKSDRTLYEKYVTELGFKIENRGKIKNANQPFKLQISRSDFVYPESINKITLELRKKALEYNGDYDGWETFVITE